VLSNDVLRRHADRLERRSLRDLFEQDPDRGHRMSVRAGGLYLDYSKNRLDDAVPDDLVGAAQLAGLPEKVDAMFGGDRLNTTEGRAVLHVAPRTLGQLIATYEHKVFVQGVLWGINSFDQWGVELGKSLARDLAEAIATGEAPASADSSTRRLLDLYGERRQP
jgi:glucose-6-phosphate isomerase